MISSAYEIPLPGPVSFRKSFICKTPPFAAAEGEGLGSTFWASDRAAGDASELGVLVL